MINLWVWDLNLKCLWAHRTKPKITRSKYHLPSSRLRQTQQIEHGAFPLDLGWDSQFFSASNHGCLTVSWTLGIFSPFWPPFSMKKSY